MPSILIASAIAFVVYWAGPLLWRYIRYKLLGKQTCVLDLEQLGLSRSVDQKIHGTAVICGGSIAGLFTARVCQDHFDEVIIVEPEVWADRPDAKRQDVWNQENTRSRIMQYESLHDFTKECQASDILHFGNNLFSSVGPADYPISTWGRWSKKPYEQYNGVLPDTITASRRGFETLLRRLVLGGRHRNIRQAHEKSASLWLSVRQTSMKWLRREGYGQSETYPSGKLPLDELKIAYDQKIVYSTLKLHVPPELGKRLPGLSASFEKCGLIYACIADPMLDCRGISLQRIEGNFDELPRTLEEIKKYAQSIVTRDPIPSWFFQILDMLEGVKDTLTCSQVPFSGASYITFDKAVNLPPNWIAIGDSVMKVNPLFGQVHISFKFSDRSSNILLYCRQGIIKALMGAICLNTLLQKRDATAEIPKDFSAEFFEMQRNKISPFWEADKVWDYGYHTTVPIAGEKLADSWFLRWYTRQLIRLSFEDEQAGSILWHANMQLAPPIDAMHPGIVLKILWATFKG
ncbi:hypothetical protein DFS33DRAFT_1275483 [Desarmillaria ectypa]|nr:hypothetical protein DFS33DRAFT_1275483 [Desarmillaria ectypa]